MTIFFNEKLLVSYLSTTWFALRLFIWSFRFSFIYLYIYLAVYLSIHPSIYLYIYLPIYLSIYLSIHPSIYLTIYLIINRIWFQSKYSQSWLLRRQYKHITGLSGFRDKVGLFCWGQFHEWSRGIYTSNKYHLNFFRGWYRSK